MSTPLGHIKYCIAFKSKILKLICLKNKFLEKITIFLNFGQSKKPQSMYQLCLMLTVHL